MSEPQCRYQRRETIVFETSGPDNTDVALEAARRRALEDGLKHIAAASARGETARKLLRLFPEPEFNIAICTLPPVKPVLGKLFKSMGDVTEGMRRLRERLIQETGSDQIEYGLPPDLKHHPRLQVVTDGFDHLGNTVFSRVPQSLEEAQWFRRQAGIKEGEAFVINTLWRFCMGTKVAVQAALAAADQGFIPPGEEALAMGGHLLGIDTVLVVKTARSEDFFSVGGFEILEFVTRPRSNSIW